MNDPSLPDSENESMPTVPAAKPRDWWKATIEACQIILAMVGITGLVFLYVQSRSLERAFDRTDRQNDIAAWSAVAQQELAIDELMTSHPTLQPYFYESKRVDIHDPDHQLILAIGTEMVDFFENTEDIINYLPPDRTEVPGQSIGPGESGMLDRATWEHYIVGSFRSGPILCQIMKERGEDYDYAIRQLAHQGCK